MRRRQGYGSTGQAGRRLCDELSLARGSWDAQRAGFKDRVTSSRKKAAHPTAAKLWLDDALSKRGKEILAKSDLGSLRADVAADMTRNALGARLGVALKPIAIGPASLGPPEADKRDAFLRQWVWRRASPMTAAVRLCARPPLKRGADRHPVRCCLAISGQCPHAPMRGRIDIGHVQYRSGKEKGLASLQGLDSSSVSWLPDLGSNQGPTD